MAVNDRGHVVGEDHHRAKLSDHDVWLMLELRDASMRYTDLAEKFGVSKATVASICQGRRRAQLVTGQRRVHARTNNTTVPERPTP